MTNPKGFSEPLGFWAVDVLLVNPPAPDGGISIRSQHRVGRRSRENMIWPQVDLAQLAALLAPEHTVEIVDAVALRMGWPEFEQLLRERRPRYYVTQVTAPTLNNDMRGVSLAHDLGAYIIVFGTHVTPMYRETMECYPAVDFVLGGEPELMLQELINSKGSGKSLEFGAIQGLVWRQGEEVVANPGCPFIQNLDDLPLPLHHLLPLERYRIPMVKGPYSFVITSRGCPGGCTFCIKHVTYGRSVRIRSPENILEELLLLQRLGVHNVHVYADLFTVNREQVMGLCELILEAGLDLRWTWNSRVDFVEEADTDRSTVMGYPNLSAEHLECWQRRAFREWAFRPGPIWTFLKSINSLAVLRSAVEIGLETPGWVRGR
jgi:anaerobic magnesium-protoporphyrin IX monomethyl ester cyclase